MSTFIDRANREFWNEVCGSNIAASLGIREPSRGSLMEFDQVYLEFYPYLLNHIKPAEMFGKRVMEVGLGYGTVGEKIAEAGADYLGLDIAEGPIRLMNHRLKVMDLKGGAIQGNMLDCPLDTESLDVVVSIGCYHHTGDLQRCIDETYRVLKPRGKAKVMVYNQFSYRHWFLWPRQTLQSLLCDFGLLKKYPVMPEEMRAVYDVNLSGEPAPETQFFSIKQLRRVFKKFSEVRLRKENCDDLRIPILSKKNLRRGLAQCARSGPVLISRSKLLPIIGRTLGIDIYIDAIK